MTGIMALVGGREHNPGCETIDQAVLAATRAVAPRVAIVPLASSMRTRARTVGRAVEWWDGLGVATVVVGPEPDQARRLLDTADVIVLTGGVPDRLHRRLRAWRTGEQVVARWRAGAALVGSSSGAMVLAAWRQTVTVPFAVRPGWGLLPGTAVAPHHELGFPRAVATVRARTHPHLTILGIDEATALVGREGRFQVLGTGAVTLHRGTWQRRYGAGEWVDLARHGVMMDEPPDVEPAVRWTHRDGVATIGQ